MRVIQTDPHAEPATWPGQWVTTVAKPMDIGLSEDSRPVRLLLLRRNALIGGIMGSENPHPQRDHRQSDRLP